MHPFDIKTIFFAKHAQHVVLIHFPIALFIIGVVFDFTGQWKGQPVLVATAYYNLLVAAISTVPVVVTGILAGRSRESCRVSPRPVAAEPADPA